MHRLCTRCKISYPTEYFRKRSGECMKCEPVGKTKGPKAQANWKQRQEYFQWLVDRDAAHMIERENDRHALPLASL